MIFDYQIFALDISTLASKYFSDPIIGSITNQIVTRDDDVFPVEL